MSDTGINYNRYEYDIDSLTKLSGHSSIRITIPYSLIVNKSLDSMRVAAYSFFYVRRGLDGMFYFSISSVLQFMNKVSNRHKGGINEKLMNLIYQFKDIGIMDIDDNAFSKKNKPRNYSIWEQFVKADFNSNGINNENDIKAYATLYWDEVLAIMNYKNPNTKDAYLTNIVVLLVFAYLRAVITKRNNKLRVDEESVQARKEKYPEAYNCFYKDVAKELGISERVMGKVLDVLDSLGFIYKENLPAIKRNGKYRTDHTIFANYYKREQDYLLASGKGYYMPEVQNKKNKIKGLIQKGDEDNG